MQARILIVDDEENMRNTLAAVLKRQGYATETAASGEEAVSLAERAAFDLIITDLKMPDMDGIEVFRRVKVIQPDIAAIIITGYASLDSAIEAIRLGAYDYIVKPFKMEQLLLSIERTIEHLRLVRENRQMRRELEEKFGLDNIVGKSKKMLEIYKIVERVAPTDATVLLRGESGTGKELFARAIHYSSLRQEKPFVPVACGALPETLMESELFGHEKGAFTGAISQKRGLFEIADGGTLFLDEIGDLTPAIQMKLLRVLQEREFTRVGGTKPIKVDVRIICATNRNLEEMVEKGEFREDLYYRINVVPIFLPPLRERKEDIPLLVQHFLAKYGASDKRIAPEAMELLMKYSWPGNVRELENVIERAVVLSEGDTIPPEVLPDRLRPCLLPEADMAVDALGMTLQEARDRFEASYLRALLEECGGNISLASKKAGISRRHFYEKMKAYGIDPKESRSRRKEQ